MSAPSSGTRNFHMIEAVAERLEGAPRQFRRRWSDEFKERAVAEAMEPGASVSAIAHRIGIHPSHLFGWRRDARAGPGLSSLPAAVEAEIGSVCARAVIEVVIADVVVRGGRMPMKRTCVA
jgi:transposase